MNNFLSVFLGFIVGVAATYLIMTYGLDKKTELKAEVVGETTPAQEEKENTVSNEVWFDLTTASGKEVRLHIAMPKDEVRQLLGKPAKTSVHQYGNDDVVEEWKYEKFISRESNVKTTDFEIKFVNEKLESVRQY